MSHSRPTVAEIDLNALQFNLDAVRKRVGPKRKILAVVKANAYGHGAIRVSKVLESRGVDFLGVALCEEGLELRAAGIKSPILVLSGFYGDQAREIIYGNLTPAIFDLLTARILSREALRAKKRLGIHVKVDTGMGRIGIGPEHAQEFFTEIRKLKGLNIKGIMTHFADADNPKKTFTRLQLERFKEVLSVAQHMSIDIPLRHLANSAAIMDFKPAYANLVRPGLMLYGVLPKSLRKKITLKPVMSLKTRVLFLKRVPKGTPISYGRTYYTKRPSLIATIPIGYADGYSRALSNLGEVLVNGKRAKVVGRVCMDLTMIDVTGIEGVKVGDEVVLMGEQGEECITVDELAEKIGTISYEVFCGISKRVPRVYNSTSFLRKQESRKLFR